MPVECVGLHPGSRLLYGAGGWWCQPAGMCSSRSPHAAGAGLGVPPLRAEKWLKWLSGGMGQRGCVWGWGGSGGVPRQGRGAGHGSQLGKGEQCVAEPLRGKWGEETNGVGVGWVFLHGESCACARGSLGTIYDLRKLSCAGTREYQLPVAALLILRGWGTAPCPPGGLGTCSELGEGACSEPGMQRSL